MRYLKKFETSTAFESFTLDENNTPNVSLIEELLNTTGGVVFTKKIAPQLQHDYSLDYFTLVAIDDCEFGFRTDCYNEGDGLSYSLDNGETWSEYYNNSYDNNTSEDNYISVTAGNKVLFKGHNFNVSANGSCSLSSIFFTESTAYYNSDNPSKFNVEGNVMSLLYGDNFIGQTSFNSESEYILSCLFHNIGGLINAENLILPATTLTYGCYQYMFSGCADLITAPSLPATTLAQGCYQNMFEGCTSLTTAPELPATTLANDCYNQMFNECTSLTIAPALPATTLADFCYYCMFVRCTSLTIAPELPATTLADSCYRSMFQGCTSLTTAPELPATTLADYCYYEMFSSCTSLTIAPELPATTLADNCYQEMFYDCTSLNSIKCLATDISADSCTYNWVNSIAQTGTFTKASDMTDWTEGEDGIPSGWTVQNAE